MEDPLIKQLRQIAKWADETATKIDFGGPRYSESEPFWQAFRSANDAIDRITYLQGKIEGMRFVREILP